MARRSVLFSPADQPDKLATAAECGADVIVFDLEDGVAADRKHHARNTVVDALPVETASEVCVRVNPVGRGAATDLAVLAETRPDCLMVPKVSGAVDIETVGQLCREYGVDAPVFALVETAAGVLAAPEIAAADPVDVLVFGAEDLAADLGATRTEDGAEVSYARQRVVLAARAHGVDAVDTHYPEIGDETGLRRETDRARRLGYDGKMAMHPRQVDFIHDAFRPTNEELAWATRILAAVDQQDTAIIEVDGEMVDSPQIRQAQRLVELADAGDEDRSTNPEQA